MRSYFITVIATLILFVVCVGSANAMLPVCHFDPILGTRCEIGDGTDTGGGTVGCTPPAVGTNYPLQGDSARCGNARPTPLSTAACPGNSTTNLIVGNFPDKVGFSECVQIDNASTKAYFIPLKTHREWAAFKSAASSNTNLNLAVRSCSCGGGTNGACGSANGTSVTMAPTANLCSAGTAGTVTQASGGEYVWTCAGSGGGTNASCATVAQCSPVGSLYIWNGINWDDYMDPNWNVSVAGFNISSPPPTISSDMVVGQGVTWVAPGKHLRCGPLGAKSGMCGTASTVATATAPTTNLCALGTASTVSNGGSTWNWTCAGTGGGSTVACTTPNSAGSGGGVCILKSGTKLNSNPYIAQMFDVWIGLSSVVGCTSGEFWSTDVPDGKYRCTSNYSLIATDCGSVGGGGGGGGGMEPGLEAN
jgi:hypothetical protein